MAFDHIAIILIIFSVLSLIGSASIVLTYVSKGVHNNFALKMVAYLSISDVIFNIANLIYIKPGTNYNYIRCDIQAVLLQYSQISQVFFCFFLCFCIYQSVIKNKSEFSQYRNKFFIIGFIVPLILSLIPLINQAYGSQDYACGFSIQRSKSSKLAVELEGIFFFYLPLWFFNIFNIVLIVKVTVFIRKLRENDGEYQSEYRELRQDQEIKLSQQIIFSMLYYPIIMIICYTPFTIFRIAQLFFNEELDWLAQSRFLVVDCQGMLNGVTFWVNYYQINKLQDFMRSDSKNKIPQKISFSYNEFPQQDRQISFVSIMSLDA